VTIRRHWRPSCGSSPTLERFELGRTLAVALDELEEEPRLAIVLADIAGLSPADVAEIMGVSRNTVYSRVSDRRDPEEFDDRDPSRR